MANEATTIRKPNPGNSDDRLRQSAPTPPDDSLSHEITESLNLDGGGHIDPDIGNHLWTPFFLLRYTLLAFIALYATISVILIALVVIDRKQQGLTSARTSQHYFWTYGPTAILTLAASLWGQVEYQAKQAMPWAILRAGPTKSCETLFIDYVSINQISALFKSFQVRHLPVALSVIGSLLMKLLIVMSTSLLVLEEQPWTIRNVPVNSTETFSSNNWGLNNKSPFWNTLALSIYNAPYPPGTSNYQTVPNLDLSHLHLGHHDIIEVDLPSFQTNLQCEAAKLISMDSCQIEEFGFTDSRLTFETPSCRFIGIVELAEGACPGTPEQYHFISYEQLLCNATGNGTLDRSRPHSDLRHIIYTGYVRPNTSEFRTYTAEDEQHGATEVSNVITILSCNLTYKLTSSSVKMDAGQMLLSYPSPTELPISSDHMPHLDMKNFITWLQYFESSGFSSELLELDEVNKQGVYSDRGDHDINDGLIGMLIFEKVQRIASLLDPHVLEATFKNFVQAVATQMAKGDLLIPGTEEFKAAIRTTQQRLRVRTLSLYGMLATLAALTIITAVLFAIAPQNIASRDTDSIGGFSTILSRSVDLSTYLRGTGCAQLTTIQDSMGTKQCRSHTTYINGHAHFGIDFYEEGGPLAGFQGSDNSAESVKWWRPLAISAAHKTMVVASIITVIVALEILYRESGLHNGLVNVSNEDSVRYTWLYAPAITMMAVQLLLGMIGSTSNLVLPYHELRLWPSSAKRTLLKNPSSCLTIKSLSNSLQQRHWAITATSLSLLLSPFLTIISAGLYTAESISRTGRIHLQIDDTLFSEKTQTQWGDRETSYRYRADVNFMTPNLIKDIIPYPLWTLHGLVFPRVSALAEDTTDDKDVSTYSDNHTTIEVSMNALRSSLECAPSPVNVTPNYVNSTFSYTYQDPTGVGNWTAQSSLFVDSPWVGTAISIRDDSLKILYGWVNDTSTVHIATCDGFVEEIRVDVTFELPSFSILDAKVHEESAHRLENSSASLDSLIDAAVVSMDFLDSHYGRYGTDGTFDPLFSMMLSRDSTHAFTMNDTIGENGFSNIVKSLEYYWQIVHPQLLNLASRKEIQGEKPIINATFTRPGQYRLQQSGISTRLLEVFLGIIAACIAISFWAMNTKEILPKNPCSVAAQASLLAGSSMLRETVIPPGSEWLSDKELLERGVFNGLLFTMGWRGGTGGEKRWFGIDVGKSDWSR